MTAIIQLYQSLKEKSTAIQTELAEMECNLAIFEAKIPNYDPTRHYQHKAKLEAESENVRAQIDSLLERMTEGELEEVLAGEVATANDNSAETPLELL